MSCDRTKPTKWVCAQRRLRSAWRSLGSLVTHWAHSEDSDQTGRMPRLIWVFAGRTVILLVLSWGGSFFSATWYENKNYPWTFFHSGLTFEPRLEKTCFATCEQQRRLSDWAPAQSDQRLCFPCLDSIIPKLAIAKISRVQRVSVAFSGPVWDYPGHKPRRQFFLWRGSFLAGLILLIYLCAV